MGKDLGHWRSIYRTYTNWNRSIGYRVAGQWTGSLITVDSSITVIQLVRYIVVWLLLYLPRILVHFPANRSHQDRIESFDSLKNRPFPLIVVHTFLYHCLVSFEESNPLSFELSPFSFTSLSQLFLPPLAFLFFLTTTLLILYHHFFFFFFFFFRFSFFLLVFSCFLLLTPTLWFVLCLLSWFSNDW